MTKRTAKAKKDAAKLVAKAVARKKAGGVDTCPNGHIVDQYGYCQTKDCKYSRDYEARKRAARKEKR
jgi:hypothetical protein